MIDGIISGAIVTALFMIFQVFFLMRWIKRHENERNNKLWTPFRKLLLDSIVRYSDSLIDISKAYETDLNLLFSSIREQGALDIKNKEKLVQLIEETIEKVKYSRNDFYNKVQTVAPALQPYAADYCNEVFWFGDGLLNSLEGSIDCLSCLNDSNLSDNEYTSHQLNGVWAKLKVIDILVKYRFAEFKDNFTQYVWKKESLHYHDGEFLPPKDYADSLEAEKSKLEIRNMERTFTPKSFFDEDE